MLVQGVRGLCGRGSCPRWRTSGALAASVDALSSAFAEVLMICGGCLGGHALTTIAGATPVASLLARAPFVCVTHCVATPCHPCIFHTSALPPSDSGGQTWATKAGNWRFGSAREGSSRHRSIRAPPSPRGLLRGVLEQIRRADRGARLSAPAARVRRALYACPRQGLASSGGAQGGTGRGMVDKQRPVR
eukprot:15462370-Alexandrium_andersonii.AAC.1